MPRAQDLAGGLQKDNCAASPELHGACQQLHVMLRRHAATGNDICASVQSLLASKSPAVEIAELQKLVLKIFWSATYMGIPALLLQEPQFVGWMTSLLQAVKQPVPQVLAAGSTEVMSIQEHAPGSQAAAGELYYLPHQGSLTH